MRHLDAPHLDSRQLGDAVCGATGGDGPPAGFFHAHFVPDLRAILGLGGVEVLVEGVKEFDELPVCQRGQDFLRPSRIAEIVEKL